MARKPVIILTEQSRSSKAGRRQSGAIALCRIAALALVLLSLAGETVAEVHFPKPDKHAGIRVAARSASKSIEGEYEVWRLEGDVTIGQDASLVAGREAVVWIDRAEKFDVPTRVIAYVEGASEAPVRIELLGEDGKTPLARQQAPHWFGRLESIGGLTWDTPPPGDGRVQGSSVHARGRALMQADSQLTASAAQPRLDTQVAPAQFAPLAPPPSPAVANAGGFRRVQLFGRGVSTQLESRQLAAGETAVVLSGGVNIVVEGIQAAGLPGALGPIDTIDLETDRAVIWTAGAEALAGGSFEQSEDVPMEIYMEGNIVFRQGERTVYANRMYYDVRRRIGVVLDAELLTPLPEVGGYQYRGLVRLKAGAIRQLDESRFIATDALVTTSRLEEPSYDFSSKSIAFTDTQRPQFNPATGLTTYDHEQLAESRGNVVHVGGWPVFYWPTIATDLTEPTFYIKSAAFRSDSVFGVQAIVDLDVYQLLGAERVPGTDWTLSLDYLNERGFGHGTGFDYNVGSFLGVEGPARGIADFWGIKDEGKDNLGLGERSVTPEASYRFRTFLNHQQQLVGGLLDGWTTQGEIGWLSDRTFLEQYYESDWDNNKDELTGVRLKRLRENRSLSIEAYGRVNDFFTQTQWLPRLDHNIIGQDLLGETLSWSGHSSIGYADIGIVSTPTSPELLASFERFPWEQPSGGSLSGERLVTRQELSLPIDAAPFKVVPYVMGEAYHTGQDLSGNDLDRLYLNTGVRASIPFVAVNPHVRDPLFNLNGLAHKVVFDVEASYADADQNYEQLPLYDDIDDDSVDEIRRRYFFAPFSGPLAGLYVPGNPSSIDPRFDPRRYYIRSGNQNWVTAPSSELVDDLTTVRFGMRHRLQTKRGGAGREHIVDWVTLDANFTIFPEANRDNFGEDFGLFDYDFRWHVGDRLTVVSDGFADTFEQGLRTASAGVLLGRPTRGNLYLGYRTVQGPVVADLISATLNYRLGPKWIGSAAAVIDLGDAGNIGQSFALSRIGESLITTLGATVDQSKGTVGFRLQVEPRFLPRLSASRRTGIDIPPAGAYGLE
ncbi:LPS-assembly protein LptD [Pirellulimonas nuda]|uniref:LPS-assembly protein LptD n=1 Tax=Pirellulimonas nuda TaxID=2528009 RepID=A0A518D734_9BACT|nr:organic solvent tolerance protein OstA [Pirellulimonas nuda]QDU87287.1 LPS-assembly protein LptD [Pirellulimonas nuda]